MAHWDEERDAGMVKKARECARTPQATRLIDRFEETGDIVYWHALLQELMNDINERRTRVPTPLVPR